MGDFSPDDKEQNLFVLLQKPLGFCRVGFHITEEHASENRARFFRKCYILYLTNGATLEAELSD
jgi:hypothetical protein